MRKLPLVGCEPNSSESVGLGLSGLDRIRLLTLLLLLLSACGGGGGGGGGAAPQPGTAVVTLSTALTATGTIPAGTTINGYEVTMDLPTGVTVKSSVTPATDPGVVVSSGSDTIGSYIESTYTAATGTIPGKIRIVVANTNGMAVGEFSKVTCDVAAGLNLNSSAFSQPSFTAIGWQTSNSTVYLTSELTLTATAVVY